MDITQLGLMGYANFIKTQIIRELEMGIYTQIPYVISVLEHHAELLEKIAKHELVDAK